MKSKTHSRRLRKVFAVTLAIVTLIAMTSMTFAATVTVPASQADHHYYAYQIFSGTQAEGESALANVEWGTGINGDAFLAALKKSTAFGSANPFADCGTAASVAVVLSKFADKSAAAEEFAALALANKAGQGVLLAAGTQSMSNGYYLIVDQTDVNGKYDVQNPALLQLTEDITINAKTDKPSIDKQVQDEAADGETGSNDGWGESADHHINEVFNFKITATFPSTTEFNRYASYKAVITDIWSNGITVDSETAIKSVKMNGTDVASSAYSVDWSTANKMVITFNNIKTINGFDASADNAIEVIYEAKLNENAVVREVSGNAVTDNTNRAYLEYTNKPSQSGSGSGTPVTPGTPGGSDNPGSENPGDNPGGSGSGSGSGEPGDNPGGSGSGDGSGSGTPGTPGGSDSELGGKTPEDWTFVFTYRANNTKYANEIADAAVLSGAGFKITDGSKWATLNADGKVTGWADTQEAGTEIVSNEYGKFDIIGLDAGTYKLVETKTPAGYNTCEDISFNISSVHSENGTGNDATVVLNGESGTTVSNSIINMNGTVLPETGGAGTIMFYLVGGCLMAAAAALLITKRKVGAGNDL